MTHYNAVDAIELRKAEDFVTPTNAVTRLFAVASLALADYVEGLDLSHHRPDVPIQTAKQQGIRFIIAKATQGNYLFNKDNWYVRYRDETRAKNLPFGAFHYWDARIPPIEQAKYFYDRTKDDLDLLPIWDIERYLNEGVLTRSVAAQNISDGLQETAQLFGRDVMIYTNRYSWQVLTNNSDIIAAYPLFVASWTTAGSPTLPYGAADWVLWQYTNNYQIEGYPRGVDASRFHGNEAAFEEYVRKITGKEEPHIHPELQEQIDELKKTVELLTLGQGRQALAIEENQTHIGIMREELFGLDARVDARLVELETRMKEISSAAAGEN